MQWKPELYIEHVVQHSSHLLRKVCIELNKLEIFLRLNWFLCLRRE
jgi:hypothetical protein